MLKCAHCGRSEPEVLFPPSAARKRDYRCLPCHRAKNAAAREASPEATRAATRQRQRAYRALHPSNARQRADKAKSRLNAKAYAQANPEKKRAHVLVQRAVAAGKLNRAPCEGCGAKKTQAHHDDYSKPLDVRWLCAKCHNRHHKWIA